jgi:hypothetical protein
MSETLSLSIFTIEADSKPLFAFAAKKHQEAVAFCADERVLTKLRSVRSGGVPLCNDYSQHTYRAPQPIDCVAAELHGVLGVHRHEQRDVDHQPYDADGFKAVDHALSFDIGIPGPAITFSMI